MKDFHCSDAGMKCDWVARGATEKEIVVQAGRHAQEVHKLTVTPELEQKVRGLIHDEASEAHKRSLARG